MKNIDVLYSFLNHNSNKTANLKTDGETLINYTTPIACWNESAIVIDRTRYSATTSRIQNALVRLVTERAIKIQYTDQIIID